MSRHSGRTTVQMTFRCVGCSASKVTPRAVIEVQICDACGMPMLITDAIVRKKKAVASSEATLQDDEE